MRLVLIASALLLAGCMSDQERADVGTIEQATYNAAESLPPTPQTTAIEANAVTVGQIVGYPLTTVSATAAAVTPATPAAGATP